MRLVLVSDEHCRYTGEPDWSLELTRAKAIVPDYERVWGALHLWGLGMSLWVKHKALRRVT